MIRFTEHWTWSISSMRDHLSPRYHRRSIGLLLGGPGYPWIKNYNRAESNRSRWRKAKTKRKKSTRARIYAFGATPHTSFSHLRLAAGTEGLMELMRGDGNREIHPSSALGTAVSRIIDFLLFLFFFPPLNVPQLGRTCTYTSHLCLYMYMYRCICASAVTLSGFDLETKLEIIPVPIAGCTV